MGYPPVCGDNPRALASGLSYVQVDKHGITILYHYISVNLAHDEIFQAKVGKGGITQYILTKLCIRMHKVKVRKRQISGIHIIKYHT